MGAVAFNVGLFDVTITGDVPRDLLEQFANLIKFAPSLYRVCQYLLDDPTYLNEAQRKSLLAVMVKIEGRKI